MSRSSFTARSRKRDMRMEEKCFSYQTVIEPGEINPLFETARHLSYVERCLFADYCRGKPLSSLKNEYLEKYQITSRHFNAMRMQLEGKIASTAALRDLQIDDLRILIPKIEKEIGQLENKKNKEEILWIKKQKLQRKKNQLSNLESDKELGKVRMCFGTKKLFRAQDYLSQNGYDSHYEWRRAFDESRNDSFFTLGSKDESAGNQTCQATPNEDGTLSLLLRLPDLLIPQYGKYLLIKNVHFAYGQKVILEALENCKKRQKLKNEGDSSYKLYGQAISYRFKYDYDKNKWHVYVSTSSRAPPICTHKERGAIGIDINVNHLALVETDLHGNPVYSKSYPLCAHGKSSDQTEALIGDISAKIVDHAKKSQKPIVLEDLDFKEKKQSLREESPHRARMLSSFFYSKVISMIQSRAYRHGVEVLSVDPAYTSVIGRIKYAKPYGFTIHNSAALVIARRGMGFFERSPCRLDNIPDGKGGYVSLPSPVRMGGKQNRSYWKIVARKLRAELAAHHWAIKKEKILTRESAKKKADARGRVDSPSQRSYPSRNARTVDSTA